MAEMPVVSITLETREGALVPLDTLAEKVEYFAAVLAAIEREVVKLPVGWGISGLSMGSARVELRSTSTDLGAEYRANLASESLQTVARAAAAGDFALIPWPETRGAARQLVSGLPGEVPGIRLGVNQNIIRIDRNTSPPIVDRGLYLGSLTGVVEGLNIHEEGRFTLYDDVFGTGIVCHMANSSVHVDLVTLLKKRVEVKGIIAPGRRRTISQIEDITILPDGPSDYTKTEGVWRDWESTWEQRLDALRGVRHGE